MHRSLPAIPTASLPRFRRAKPWFCVVLLIIAAQATPSWACKYSVRDVGFVDLASSPYRLTIYLPEDVTVERRAQVQAVMTAVLTDTNVRGKLTVGGPDDAVREQLRLADDAPPPTAVIAAPDGRLLALGDNWLASDDNLWTGLQAVVQSETRRQIKAQTLAAHSVILVVEGADAAHNQRAREIAQGASKTIAATLRDLPKPIARPPHVLVVTRDMARQDSLLLWSLGVSVDRQTAEDASIAILFGRSRRLGPLLTVPGATEAGLTANLSYIGQDCECELDRSWMTGPMLPHGWSAEDEAALVRELGFDAGNPLVMAEIAQIISRGPGFRGGERKAGEGGGEHDASAPAAANAKAQIIRRPTAAADPLKGYQELPADASASAPPMTDAGEIDIEALLAESDQARGSTPADRSPRPGGEPDTDSGHRATGDANPPPSTIQAEPASDASLAMAEPSAAAKPAAPFPPDEDYYRPTSPIGGVVQTLGALIVIGVLGGAWILSRKQEKP